MSRPYLAPLLGSLSLAFAVSACSEADEGGQARIASLGAPIQDGRPADGQSSIVGLQSVVGSNGNSLQTLLCTGSLIAPNLVLTARHCISRVASSQVSCGKAPFSDPLPANKVNVTTADEMPTALKGSQPNGSPNYIEASEVLVPDEGNDVCGFDVALVVLRQKVAASVAEPLEPRIDDPVDVNEAYRAVGFGATSGDGTAPGGAGVRRERTGLKSSCIEGEGSDCSLSSGSEWEGEAGVCEGDSGGPALDSKNRVIGVASRSVFEGPNQEFCRTPIYSAVAGWADWIREVALHAAEVGNYEPAEWVTARPISSGGSGGSNGQPTGDKGNASSGDDNDGSSGGGCAVRAPGGASGGLWLLGAALGLAARARRRRAG